MDVFRRAIIHSIYHSGSGKRENAACATTDLCQCSGPQTSLYFPQDTLNQSHGIGHLLYGLRMVRLSICALTTGKDTIFPDQNKDKKKFYFLIPLHHLII